MWEFNQDDVNEEISSGGKLDKSGCYEATIDDIEITTTTNGAEQVIIKLNVDGSKTTIFHVYTKVNGEILDFKVRTLNHLLYINKLKSAKEIIKLIGTKNGFMLKAKKSQDGKYTNFDIDGVYHIQTGKTAKELKDNTPAKVVENKRKQYEKESGLDVVESFAKIEDDDDEFPF